MLYKKIYILLPITTFFIGLVTHHSLIFTDNLSLPINKTTNQDKKEIDFNIFWKTWELIEQESLDKNKLDNQKLLYGSIKGMVRTLGDPFTIFLTPAEHKAFQESLTGIFEGYGFEVVQDSEKRFYFKNVLPGSPAESAGIENGGEVIKINGNELKNYQLSEVMQVLSDSAKSKIKLTFIGIKGLHDVEIKTEKFIVKTVKYQKLITKDNKQIAYIKVSRFGKNTINEWDAAVEKILNDKSVGVIVDLRDNLGGFPSVPIHIASEFIQKGPLYIDENNQGERKLVVVDKSGHLNNLPVVVLINKKSTSATELLASTIQFNKRGILVGEKSSGKGSIQNIYNLSDGSGLHVTVAKWFKPNGESVEKVGLIPDINVDQLGENINESDKTVQQAIKVLSN